MWPELGTKIHVAEISVMGLSIDVFVPYCTKNVDPHGSIICSYFPSFFISKLFMVPNNYMSHARVYDQYSFFSPGRPKILLSIWNFRAENAYSHPPLYFPCEGLTAIPNLHIALQGTFPINVKNVAWSRVHIGAELAPSGITGDVRL